MDPYRCLGISRDADEETIKKAYRKAVKECHPDTHPGDRKAEARFKEVAAAYEILGSSQKRKKYIEESTAKTPNQVKKRTGYGTSKNTRQFNPQDVSAMFEKYMGFK